jgi:hypothetical protein
MSLSAASDRGFIAYEARVCLHWRVCFYPDIHCPLFHHRVSDGCPPVFKQVLYLLKILLGAQIWSILKILIMFHWKLIFGSCRTSGWPYILSCPVNSPKNGIIVINYLLQKSRTFDFLYICCTVISCKWNCTAWKFYNTFICYCGCFQTSLM